MYNNDEYKTRCTMLKVICVFQHNFETMQFLHQPFRKIVNGDDFLNVYFICIYFFVGGYFLFSSRLCSQSFNTSSGTGCISIFGFPRTSLAVSHIATPIELTLIVDAAQTKGNDVAFKQ